MLKEIVFNPIFMLCYFVIGLIFAYYLYKTRNQGWQGNWRDLTWYQLLPFVFLWPIFLPIEIYFSIR